MSPLLPAGVNQFTQPCTRELYICCGEGLNLSRPDFDLSLAARAKQLGAVVVTDARIAALSQAAGTWHLSVGRVIRHAILALTHF